MVNEINDGIVKAMQVMQFTNDFMSWNQLVKIKEIYENALLSLDSFCDEYNECYSRGKKPGVRVRGIL